MERVKGIEPSSVAWEATALPLSYTRRVQGLWPRPRVPATRYPWPMKLIVNGDARELPAPQTVASLLIAEGQGSRRVAVEVNREIVPRSRHAEHLLHDGDQIELTQAIGGG